MWNHSESEGDAKYSFCAIGFERKAKKITGVPLFISYASKNGVVVPIAKEQLLLMKIVKKERIVDIYYPF